MKPEGVGPDRLRWRSSAALGLSILGLGLASAAGMTSPLSGTGHESFLAARVKPSLLDRVQVNCGTQRAIEAPPADLILQDDRDDHGYSLLGPWNERLLPRTSDEAMTRVLATSYPNLTLGDFITKSNSVSAIFIGQSNGAEAEAAFYFDRLSGGWRNTAIQGCASFLTKALTRPDLRVRLQPPQLHPDADQIYAAVIRSLVGAGSDYDRLFIDSSVGQKFWGRGPTAELPDSVQEGIVRNLADFRSAEFRNSERMKSVLQKDGSAVKHRGLIATLGFIETGGEEVYVQAGTYCANLCAWGTTYVLRNMNGAWLVTGEVGGHWMA